MHQVACAAVAHNIVSFVIALLSSDTKIRIGTHAPSRKRSMTGRLAERYSFVGPVVYE